MVDAATWNADDLPVELRLAKETARRFADESLRPLARQRQALEAVPLPVRRAFAELGLGLSRVPQAVGGIGLGALAACLTDEAVASGDVNAAFALPQPGPFVDLVTLLANRQQRAIWLHPFLQAAEQSWGALALAAPGGLQALAVDGGLRLTGRAPAVWHVGRAERFAVVADEMDATGQATGRRVAAVLEREDPGVAIYPPLALGALPLSAAAPVVLNNVRVGRGQWLAGADVENALKHVLAAQSLRMASYALGAARGACAYVLAYAERQRQVGKPLPHYQSMGFLLVDMHLAVETALQRLREVAARATETGLCWLQEQASARPGPPEQQAQDVQPRPLTAEVVAAVHKARADADEVAFFVTDGALQILHDGPDIDDATHPVAGWHKDVTLLARTYPPQLDRPASAASTPDAAGTSSLAAADWLS